jgi:hypothetical protein
MPSTYEPAGREGDAERGAAAQAPAALSRHQRKVLAVALAALACAAVVAVAGVGDDRAARELLAASVGDAGAQAAHSRGVLQQLLAEVERANSDISGIARPVELEQKAANGGLPKKPCDAACKQRKKEIADRMKALRDQINHDFKAMTSTCSSRAACGLMATEHSLACGFLRPLLLAGCCCVVYFSSALFGVLALADSALLTVGCPEQVLDTKRGTYLPPSPSKHRS